METLPNRCYDEGILALALRHEWNMVTADTNGPVSAEDLAGCFGSHPSSPRGPQLMGVVVGVVSSGKGQSSHGNQMKLSLRDVTAVSSP